jgi:DNA-binding CsgD family transcriptional regulator
MAVMGRTRQLEVALTARQREVLKLIRRGHTNSEIAERLGISLAGAKWHVSELLAKYGVDTREDLADRAAQEASTGRRVRRWLNGLWFLPVSHAQVGLAAAGTIAVVGAGAAVALLRDDGGNATFAENAPPATATLTPPASPTPGLLTAPGAKWSPDEALAKAEGAVRDQFAHDLNATIVPGTFRLIGGRWLGQATGVPAGDPDGDYTWEPQNGVPTDVWLVSWEIPGSTISDYSGQLTFHATVIVKDGGDGKALADYTNFGKPAGIDGLSGHVGGFRSKRMEAELEKYRHDRAQVGDAVPFGWYNDIVDGGAWVEAYPAGGGGWCVLGRDSVGGGTGDWCQTEADPRDDTFTANLSTSFTADGVMGDATFFVIAREPVVAIGVRPGDGRRLEFRTYSPPAESHIDRRFAWINVGKVTNNFTVFGLDAAGNEVASVDRTVPAPPPPHAAPTP